MIKFKSIAELKRALIVGAVVKCKAGWLNGGGEWTEREVKIAQTNAIALSVPNKETPSWAYFKDIQLTEQGFNLLGQQFIGHDTEGGSLYKPCVLAEYIV